MSEWKEYKLGDCIQLIGGGTPKTSEPRFWNGGIPWLSVVDFNTNKKYVSSTEKTITDEGLNNSSTKILQKDDIIISARGTVGAMAVLKISMAFNQSCYGVRNIETIVSQDYLYYLLKNSINDLKQMSHGGVFDTITKNTFDSIDILLPPLKEQERIAGILSSLDDKIDLLTRQNCTLESMAETLFRQYFIENPKEEWKEKSLFDCIKLVGGGTPKTSIETYWDGDICWLSGGDISDNHKGYITQSEKTISTEGLSNSSAKLLPTNATVISARGTVGKYCLLSKPMAFSQSNYGVLPQYSNCYYFTFLLIAYSVSELQSAAYGSVFDTITTNSFKSLTVCLPDDKDIYSFELLIQPYFDKIRNNTLQIRSLAKLRDTLLPKLMNREIKIQSYD